MTPIKKVALVDVDGLIADFHSAYVRVHNEVSGESIRVEDVMEWDVSKGIPSGEQHKQKVFEILTQPGFAFGLLPYPGAVEGVRKLMQIAEVHFVTSPMRDAPTWTSDRERWLTHFLGVHADTVTHTREKFRVSGDLFVDDRSKHVAAWARMNPGGIALLWDTHYNQRDRGFRRAHSWDQVCELVEQKKIA